MFVADRLVYLQLQKTGCSHIAAMLSACVPGRDVSKHYRLPPDLIGEARQIVGSIRNPWDWYVSLWAYGCGRQGQTYRRLTARRFRGHGISRTPLTALRSIQWQLVKPVSAWRETYADPTNPQLFRDWLRLVLSEQGRRDLPERYGFSSMSSFAGFLTYGYIRLFSRDISKIHKRGYFRSLHELQEFDGQNNILDAVIRTESLEDDFIRIVRDAGYMLRDDQLAHIRSARRTKASSRNRDAGYYYDRQTTELVAEKERLIVDKYGYEPPQVT